MSLKSIQREREYTKFVVDERLCYYEPSKNKSEKTFVEELSLSLNQKHKSIAPKFFYDKKGSKLFEDICKLPEYSCLFIIKLEFFFPIVRDFKFLILQIFLSIFE